MNLKCKIYDVFLKGYLNNPEATAEYFTEDGYAAMGDLGYYDEEGRMFYKDRIKDVMRVKAKWFGPSQLEEHVEMLDQVYEVCVWVSEVSHRKLKIYISSSEFL